MVKLKAWKLRNITTIPIGLPISDFLEVKDWLEHILDKYKVKVNPSAVRELDQIYEYIANEKFAPENAREQVDRIKKAVLSLDTFPH